ncbi:MAG: serine/threonine protein kinase, partial [Chloroflexi bacterium]|nr:serine/threonine protein kinase [Chloroflexota bacterium]
MTDHVGQQLGNYRLIRQLGEGGFAEVYLGEHVYLKTYAAVKVLQARLASDKHEAFLSEARAIARLKHANIVRVLEFGVEGNTPFLVMEYAPNGSLRQSHPQGARLPLTVVLPYVKQACTALQYAHDQKLIHRDVKPENMLLRSHNELLLSDFGIAQVIQSTRSLHTPEIVGTITYMAPEQFQDQSLPASDQYALGVVVYEWLSGEYPFHGSFTEIASQHLFVPPPPLHEKGTELPPAVEEVVLTALAKNPEQRFARILDFATALEEAYHTGKRASVAPSFSSSSPDLSLNPQGEKAAHATQSPNNTPQTLPAHAGQQQPQRPRGLTGWITLLITAVILAMVSSSGLTYYLLVARPAQLQALASSAAQAKQVYATAQA